MDLQGNKEQHYALCVLALAPDDPQILKGIDYREICSTSSRSSVHAYRITR